MHNERRKARILLNILIPWFWIMSGVGFVVQVLLPEEYAPLINQVGLLADATIALLGLVTIRHKVDYMILAAYVAITAYSNVIVNNTGIMLWLNGMRTYFDFVFGIPVLRYFWSSREAHEELMKALPRQINIFLVLMAITITIQFILYGPGDDVGGIFGNLNSGVASLTIYCASFYMMQSRVDRSHLGKSIIKNFQYVLLLYPTFLNETKISFILLALYFILLLPIDASW